MQSTARPAKGKGTSAAPARVDVIIILLLVIFQAPCSKSGIKLMISPLSSQPTTLTDKSSIHIVRVRHWKFTSETYHHVSFICTHRNFIGNFQHNIKT